MVTEMKALYEKFCKIEDFLVQAFLCYCIFSVFISHMPHLKGSYKLGN